jgi:hypothetical protein
VTEFADLARVEAFRGDLDRTYTDLDIILLKLSAVSLPIIDPKFE